jgi:hypothetical protein
MKKESSDRRRIELCCRGERVDLAGEGKRGM